MALDVVRKPSGFYTIIRTLLAGVPEYLFNAVHDGIAVEIPRVGRTGFMTVARHASAQRREMGQSVIEPGRASGLRFFFHASILGLMGHVPKSVWVIDRSA